MRKAEETSAAAAQRVQESVRRDEGGEVTEAERPYGPREELSFIPSETGVWRALSCHEMA